MLVPLPTLAYIDPIIGLPPNDWPSVLAVGAGVVALLACFTAPMIWCAVQYRREHRQPGLCGQCGYDLRASRDRCPECGEPIAELALNCAKE